MFTTSYSDSNAVAVVKVAKEETDTPEQVQNPQKMAAKETLHPNNY